MVVPSCFPWRYNSQGLGIPSQADRELQEVAWRTRECWLLRTVGDGMLPNSLHSGEALHPALGWMKRLRALKIPRHLLCRPRSQTPKSFYSWSGQSSSELCRPTRMRRNSLEIAVPYTQPGNFVNFVLLTPGKLWVREWKKMCHC